MLRAVSSGNAMQALTAVVLFCVSPTGHTQNAELNITLPNPEGRDPVFDESGAGNRIDIEFSDLDTNEGLSLDASAGSLRLINFWATWCVPCVMELPSLAALAQRHVEEPFEVIPISLDQKGAGGVPEFIAELGVQGLDWYADPTAQSGQAADVFALPTSIIVDVDGNELGRITGSADWQSPEALRLIELLLDAIDR